MVQRMHYLAGIIHVSSWQSRLQFTHGWRFWCSGTLLILKPRLCSLSYPLIVLLDHRFSCGMESSYTRIVFGWAPIQLCRLRLSLPCTIVQWATILGHPPLIRSSRNYSIGPICGLLSLNMFKPALFVLKSNQTAQLTQVLSNPCPYQELPKKSYPLISWKGCYFLKLPMPSWLLLTNSPSSCTSFH